MIEIFTLLLILLFYIGIIMIAKKNKNIPKKENTKAKANFAILIPARDESKVIENLLKSIQNQTVKVPMENVYVIIESSSDPTKKICEKYKTNVFIRKKLELQRKGYALNECLEEIYTKDYDAYFIFDADNILEKDYIKNMIPIWEQGYDLGIGYRNIKNGNKVLPSASALTFSIINTLSNERKAKETRNITLSGTGFYIHGKWIKKWKGFPFHELTEDYELYLYSICNNMTSFYNKKSIFYDEQPTTYKQFFIQRQRWIKGYFTSRRKYIKKIKKSISKNDPNIASKILEIIGLIPIVIPIILAILGILIHILENNKLGIFLDILTIYGILMLLTIYILKREEKDLDIEEQIKWKVVLYHPILLLSYVPCFISILFKKEIKWKKIEHTENEKIEKH